MTRRILSNTTEKFYVNFRVYHLCFLTSNGKKFTDEKAVREYINKVDDVEYKKVPDSSSFVTMQLERDVSRGETVKEVCDRLKKILMLSDAHWQILSAKETDEERVARRADEGLELVSESKEAKRPVKGAQRPIIAVNDDDLGITPDTGKVTKKARKATKKPEETAQAA